MKNIFLQSDAAAVMNRIYKLNADSKPLWGKMSVAQMLAHCNVSYELVYDNKHPRPGGFKKFLLRLFVKKLVVSEKPYPKNGRTAPEFLVQNDKDFEPERQRLIAYIQQTQQLGGAYFEGKASHSFGPLTQQEWNNMFYKHLDHHLNQFGV